MHPDSPTKPRNRSSGFSLLETVLAIVVLSISLTGTLMVMDYTGRHSADPMIQLQAVAVAETYLAEIMLQSYIDPDLDPVSGAVCPTKEASRDLYDNICDYDGLNDSGASTRSGASVTGLESYTVVVSVDTIATLNSLSGSAKVLRIDVAVTHPASDSITLSGYRSKI